MNEMERAYISDSEAYKVFVGQITPQEFIKPFGSNNPIAKAIDHLVKNWTFDEPLPSWLEPAIFRYVEDRVDAEPPINRLPVPFEDMTDEEQEQAFRSLLRQMNSRQLWRAFDIMQQFLMDDNAERKSEEPLPLESLQGIPLEDLRGGLW